MKRALVSLTLATLLSAAPALADSQQFFASEHNGSIRQMDANDAFSSLVISYKNKQSHAEGQKSKTWQFSAQGLDFTSVFNDLEGIQAAPLNAKVRATGGNELAESFALSIELANANYNGQVGSAALFQETLTDSHNNSYKLPALYVNIDGRYVPAKGRYLQAPTLIKGNGKHLFKVVATDILDHLIVGFVEAKQEIRFSKEGYFLAKGERLPVYWTLKAESKSSCNKACKAQDEAHLSVSPATILGNGKKLSNIKAKDSNGEIMDWFQYNDDVASGALQGLSHKAYGISRDPIEPDTYWVYGSALAPRTDAEEGQSYYQTDKNKTPAAAIAIRP